MIRYLIASLGMYVALSGMAVQAGDAGAQVSPLLTQQATGHGLRLQLSIPRLTYPRAALVRITIAVIEYRADGRGPSAPHS